MKNESNGSNLVFHLKIIIQHRPIRPSDRRRTRPTFFHLSLFKLILLTLYLLICDLPETSLATENLSNEMYTSEYFTQQYKFSICLNYSHRVGSPWRFDNKIRSDQPKIALWITKYLQTISVRRINRTSLKCVHWTPKLVFKHVRFLRKTTILILFLNNDNGIFRKKLNQLCFHLFLVVQKKKKHHWCIIIESVLKINLVS